MVQEGFGRSHTIKFASYLRTDEFRHKLHVPVVSATYLDNLQASDGNIGNRHSDLFHLHNLRRPEGGEGG